MRKERKNILRHGTMTVLFVLMFVLALQTLVTVSAAEQESMTPSELTTTVESTTNSYENFVKTRIYTAEMFVDINENAWYGLKNEKAVAMVYEYGLMAGYPDQTFKPDGNLSIAEAITIATRIYSIYSTGNQLQFDPIPDAPWYQGNINYAIEKGIIEAGVFEEYTSIATRAQMAYIFAHALPDPDETYRHRYQLELPPDVDESTPFYEEIMMLYKAGIVGGSDSIGTFHPNSNITRAQAAAIITRLVDYDARLGDTWYYPGWTS
ncbi:MAG: S-layer homology domain-containing protein [Oscillospiraceae bacterium]|nr:S-layer homology domain-containing protein [Oscillospiraceae bacterium]